MDRSLSKDCVDFINDEYLESLASSRPDDRKQARDIIAKSMAKEPLTVEETAALLSASGDPEITEEIFAAARQLKRDVYGNRIVLFAPLYIGNKCVNNCLYCAFRSANKGADRVTLGKDELIKQVEALEDMGQKRLILVFGETPEYNSKFIADCVRTVYAVKKGRGEIRRVNINAAPFDHAGFKEIKAAGIGTYQIFQETYHHGAYKSMHPGNTPKGDYLFRLDGLSRAFEAGCDDIGIGALFGLYKWRFETLGLVAHSNYLRGRFGVGPHTISFPRVKPAHGVTLDNKYFVDDADFKKVIAILRLAVPYTGLILTARENAVFRKEIMEFGVSQIDGGTKLELGGYTDQDEKQRLEREQFECGDPRPLSRIISGLLDDKFIPSFCTSCYRRGRTGKQFMEYAIPGFIERFCTPNALLTLAEYLEDYAPADVKEKGWRLIEEQSVSIADPKIKADLADRLQKIKSGVRDLYF
jgi:2-iminoacetate synthase